MSMMSSSSAYAPGENSLESDGNCTVNTFCHLRNHVFPYFANTFGGDPVFLFFTIMMVVQLIFVWKIMPETKGKSLEELEKELGVKSMEV